jgi:hypothetical protein
MNTPNTINDGGEAFPSNGPHHLQRPGMSLRAYFAGQALVGELAASSTKESVAALIKAAKESGNTAEQHIVIQCVRYADALIAELNKTQ